MKRLRIRTSAFSWVSILVMLGLLAPPVSAQTEIQFTRGDCNADGGLDISDAVFLLIFNFGGGARPVCLDACDVNDDGSVLGQVTDAIALLGYMFLAGNRPPSPGPGACGVDPTADTVDCMSFPPCVQGPPPEECTPLNVSSAGEQRNSDCAVAPSGNFIVAWEDDRDADRSFNIRVGSFTPDENDIIDPFTVNTTTAGQQINPAVAWDKDENFVVVWQDDGGDGLYQIKARGFNADGTERFPQFTVNEGFSRGQQELPDVAMADDGSFVVVFQDCRQCDELPESRPIEKYDIRARGFGPDGVERLPYFTVNPTSRGQQTKPAIAMNPATGSFVVVWEHDGNEDGLYEILGRGFNADGTARLLPGDPAGEGEIQINAHSTGQQLNPAIAMDGNGNFVVVWENDGDQPPDGQFELKGRGFNADGTERIPQFDVNVLNAGQQINPSIAMNPSGKFAVAWEDDRDGDGEFHIRMRAFNADATERMEQRKLDCMEPAQHLDPSVAVDASGRVLVFWNEIDQLEFVQVIGRILEEPTPATP